MRVELPKHTELTELIQHRDEASISMYLPSSPLPRDTEASQLRLKNAASTALSQLKEIGVAAATRDALAGFFDELQTDREFWAHQARSIALFAAPDGLRVYRLANSLKELVAVGDRFDVGPLLRALTFPSGGYVLTLAEGDVHLYEVSPDDRPSEIPLENLPDTEVVLENDVTHGRFDRHRATGATGQKIEHQRYCSLVQDSVLAALKAHGANGDRPLILSSSLTFATAYREINTYTGLLEKGIEAHPDALTISDIDERARALLDDYYAAQLADVRERFGNLGSEGKATSQLTEAARAATAGAAQLLLFDMDSTTIEGSIDAAGVVTFADEAGPLTYGLVDEIAVRVLNSGGTVCAVRKGDLPDETSPVAAILRFPL